MGQYFMALILDTPKKGGKEKVLVRVPGYKLMEHSWITNPMVNEIEKLMGPDGKYAGYRLIWAGEAAKPERRKRGSKEPALRLLDFPAEETIKVDHFGDTEGESIGFGYQYVLNHDQMLFVDKKKLKEGEHGIIHPVPILTCEDDGRHDYYGNQMMLTGTWARDRISFTDEKPGDDFEELPVDFFEFPDTY